MVLNTKEFPKFQIKSDLFMLINKLRRFSCRKKNVVERNCNCEESVLADEPLEQVFQIRLVFETVQDVLRRLEFKNSDHRDRERVSRDRPVHHKTRWTRGRRCWGELVDHWTETSVLRDTINNSAMLALREQTNNWSSLLYNFSFWLTSVAERLLLFVLRWIDAILLKKHLV